MNLHSNPSFIRSAARWLAAIAAILGGLWFAGGGGVLLSRGGSLYYLVTGVVMVAAGVGLIKRRSWGGWLLLLAMAGTAVWAVWDAGWHFWPWFSRSFAFLVLGFLACVAWPQLGGPGGVARPRRGVAGIGALVLGLCAAGVFAAAFFPHGVIRPATPPSLSYSEGTPQDWTQWGGNIQGQRFANIDQIKLRIGNSTA